jgi:hypothetical protein
MRPLSICVRPEQTTPFWELTGLRVIWFPPGTLAGAGFASGTSEERDVRRGLATTLAAGLLVVACSGGDDADPLALEATPEPTPTAAENAEPDDEPEDPYAVPDEIDEAYVERVINAILEVQDSVLKGALQQPQGELLSAELAGLHFATTAGTERTTGLEELQSYIDEVERRENFRPVEEMGSSSFSLERLVHAEPDSCVIAIGLWDLSPLVVSPPPPDDFSAFSLSRVPIDERASEGNPTPWQWRDVTQMADGRGPISRDEWDGLDYGSALDHTCENL